MKIIVMGDYNDADFLTEVSDITEEQLRQVMPVIQEIKKFTESRKRYEHNWPDPERDDTTVEQIYPNLTQEQIKLFESFCPIVGDGEYSIYNIELIELVHESEILLKSQKI